MGLVRVALDWKDVLDLRGRKFTGYFHADGEYCSGSLRFNGRWKLESE